MANERMYKEWWNRSAKELQGQQDIDLNLFLLY